jgi:hypothetical protein
MDWSLVLGVYATILSTSLAMYQVIKDRRKVVLKTELGSDQSVYIVIVNVAHRPVTIAGVSVFRYIKSAKKSYWDSFEDFIVYSMINPDEVFPKTLAEGEHFRFELPEQVYLDTRDVNVTKVKYMAYDVEGRRYIQIEDRLKPAKAP